MGTGPRKYPYGTVPSGAGFWNCALWRKETRQGTVSTALQGTVSTGLLATLLRESEKMIHNEHGPSKWTTRRDQQRLACDWVPEVLIKYPTYKYAKYEFIGILAILRILYLFIGILFYRYS